MAQLSSIVFFLFNIYILIFSSLFKISDSIKTQNPKYESSKLSNLNPPHSKLGNTCHRHLIYWTRPWAVTVLKNLYQTLSLMLSSKANKPISFYISHRAKAKILFFFSIFHIVETQTPL